MSFGFGRPLGIDRKRSHPATDRSLRPAQRFAAGRRIRSHVMRAAVVGALLVAGCAARPEMRARHGAEPFSRAGSLHRQAAHHRKPQHQTAARPEDDAVERARVACDRQGGEACRTLRAILLGEDKSPK